MMGRELEYLIRALEVPLYSPLLNFVPMGNCCRAVCRKNSCIRIQETDFRGHRDVYWRCILEEPKPQDNWSAESLQMVVLPASTRFRFGRQGIRSMSTPTCWPRVKAA